MFSVLLFSILVIIVGVAILIFLIREKTRFGILAGKNVYKDTTETPGEILYAKTLSLCGKPDYIMVEKNIRIPVEVKTGRVPNDPYVNHTMQLMAYCLLVEEHFGTRPPGGYLRYQTDKENYKQFKIAYTKDAEASVRNLVKEMVEKKENGEELFCNHPQHNINNEDRI